MSWQNEVGIVEPLVERLIVGPWATNCYVVRCPVSAKAVIIDPAADADIIERTAADSRPERILLTHGHIDHIGAVAALKRRLGIPVGMHRLDAGLAQITPDFELKDGDTIPLGQLAISVLHTPGHTPGSVTLVVKQQAFVGDLIFPGGPGMTRTPVDFDQILRSITGKILPLPPQTTLHPGHGEGLTVSQARDEVSAFLSRPAQPDLCGQVRWESNWP